MQISNDKGNLCTQLEKLVTPPKHLYADKVRISV